MKLDLIFVAFGLNSLMYPMQLLRNSQDFSFLYSMLFISFDHSAVIKHSKLIIRSFITFMTSTRVLLIMLWFLYDLCMWEYISRIVKIEVYRLFFSYIVLYRNFFMKDFPIGLKKLLRTSNNGRVHFMLYFLSSFKLYTLIAISRIWDKS